MEMKKRQDKILFQILGLKASHITGIIISSYITIIFIGIGIKEQTISWIVASIGLTYPIISMISGIISDYIGRYRVYVFGKVISCIFIIIALFFTHSKILAVCLYITEAVENGIEPLIYAVATDNSTKNTRMKVFTWLSLGGSIGMMVIAIASAYLMDVNMKIYMLVLMILEIISIYFMHELTRNKTTEVNNDEEITESMNDETEKEKLIDIIKENKYLIVFSIICITFSILYSQLNYSFALKLKDMYGKKIEGKFGILLSVYYLVTIIFTICYNKRNTKSSCIDNLIVAGIIYTASMLLITVSANIVMLGISSGIWAVAQMLAGINNNVFVSENCSENNVGTITVIFSIISASGVVIGPIISGFVIHNLGITTNWIVMSVLGALGTIGLISIKNKYKYQIKLED